MSNDQELIAKLSCMCMEEEYSNVDFMVGRVTLPAHKIILAQRSPVFRDMFSNIKEEDERRLFFLTEISVDGLKSFLKYMYTGIIDLKTLQINVCFGVLRLAITYKVVELEKLTMDHFMSICNADNVLHVLTGAAKMKHTTLIAHCLAILKTKSHNTSDLEVFRTIVNWMKANPAEFSIFPVLFKQIELRTLTINEIVDATRSLELFNGRELLDIAYEQAQQSSGTLKKIPILHSGVKLKTDDNLIFSTNSVTICPNSLAEFDLNGLYTLNHLKFELTKGDWSYRIEVSTDYLNWTRIIDYSRYICRGVQMLYFNERRVRYIRLFGTSFVDGMVKILRLEAYRSTQPFEVDIQTGVVIPLHNVALAENNAVVIRGGNPTAMINGVLNDGFHTWNYIGCSIVVQLSQPYSLGSMNLFLDESQKYSYEIEVSADKIHWTTVSTVHEEMTSRRYTEKKIVTIGACVTIFPCKSGLHALQAFLRYKL